MGRPSGLMFSRAGSTCRALQTDVKRSWTVTGRSAMVVPSAVDEPMTCPPRTPPPAIAALKTLIRSQLDGGDRTARFGLLPTIGYNPAMPHRTPWDGRELITDVLERFALIDDFQAAIEGGERKRVVRLLCAIGVTEETARKMAELLIPVDGEPPRRG
jgi:hypothetical protein